MRHYVLQVKTAEIPPSHYLKCTQYPHYNEVERPDEKIQRFLLWAHKTGLLAVWAPGVLCYQQMGCPSF